MFDKLTMFTCEGRRWRLQSEMGGSSAKDIRCATEMTLIVVMVPIWGIYRHSISTFVDLGTSRQLIAQ